MMTKEKQRADFIAKAKDAEKRAARGKNYYTRHAWFTIASSYRILAQALDFPSQKAS